MIFLFVFITIVILYILFIAIPAAALFRFIFSRKESGIPLNKRQLAGTRYEPYIDALLSAEAFVEGIEAEKVRLIARDGAVLRGSYLDNHSEKTVIFVHGYRGIAVSNFCMQAEHLYRQGFNVLLITQRAHGESGGRWLGLGCLEQYDLLGWIDLAAQKHGVNHILLYGSSMGGATVGFASDKFTNPKVKAMVIDCAYSSPRKQLVRDSQIRRLPYPLLIPLIRMFAKLILKIDINSAVGESLKNTDIPVLFLHGTADTTVPFEQGIENYEACKSEKEFIQVDGAQHILAYVTGGEETKCKVDAFIAKHLK